MCLILFSYQPHTPQRLLVAANRDEFFARPASSAKPWEDNPNIIAGRDLEAGGSWLGINRNGRFCAVTNYRSNNNTAGTLSRGQLIADFLNSNTDCKSYLQKIQANKHCYAGFNLLVDDGSNFYYYSNTEDNITLLTAGYYGLSNAFLNTDWPKTRRGISAIKKHLETEDLFSALADQTIAPDEDLPNTGVGIEMERMLSPSFIQSEVYGTRASTVVKIGTQLSLHERGFSENGTIKHDVSFTLSRR